jgi:hypothetical protein
MNRWKCESYCLCGSRRGHFKRQDDGEWVMAADVEQLRTVLERYMFAYPAFRMKPIGAPGSPQRIESERLMALEEAAREALGSPTTSSEPTTER